MAKATDRNMYHQIYRMFTRYAAMASLVLSACAPKNNTAPETPAAHEAHPDSAPTADTVAKHLPHGDFSTMETSCGIELVVQTAEHFIRGRFPIVGLRQQTEGEAVFEGALMGVELLTRDADDLSVTGLRDAQLLPPFRQSQVARASKDAPELVATTSTLTLADAPVGGFVDHWELESRDKSKKRQYIDGFARIYTTVAADDVVFGLVTYVLPDDDNVRNVHAGFARSIRIEEGFVDLPALQGALQQRTEQDPDCREDPTVIRADEVDQQ